MPAHLCYTYICKAYLQRVHAQFPYTSSSNLVTSEPSYVLFLLLLLLLQCAWLALAVGRHQVPPAAPAHQEVTTMAAQQHAHHARQALHPVLI
jgi:hypothetical protein